jgi:hypothetical protein
MTLLIARCTATTGGRDPDSRRLKVFVRGGRLDHPGRVRFDRGKVPALEMRIRKGNGPRDRPSYTRLRGPGCYAYQIDGATFSRVIVFGAELAG